MLCDNNGKSRKFSIAHLVARAFIPRTASDKKQERFYAHHKNWDVTYNYYWNLEWRSSGEIALMGHLQETKDITDQEVAVYVCKLLEKGTTIGDTYEMIGRRLSKDKISKIKNRVLYASISADYEF